ncbi:MAG: hypothetical protein ACKO63_09190 [Nodosilinea sp.]
MRSKRAPDSLLVRAYAQGCYGLAKPLYHWALELRRELPGERYPHGAGSFSCQMAQFWIKKLVYLN